MKTLNIFLLCCIAIAALKGMAGLDYSKKNEVSECIESIVKTTEPLADLTVVNFKNNNELTFLITKDVKFSTRSFFRPDNMLPNRFYVIESENYGELESGVQQLRNDFFWNPRGKFIIVIEEINEEMNLVSSLLIKYNIFNVTVVISGESDYEIYGFDPQPDSCGKPAIKSLQLITQCTRLRRPTHDLFRYKTPKKFKGCKIKIVSHNYWPFVSFNKTYGLGLTQHILKLWSDTEGIEIELIKHGKDEDFGTVLDNFTFTGMIQWIETGDATAAAGGLAIFYPRARALDYSYPYSLDYNKVVVARAPFMSNWKAVLTRFSLHVTIIICLFIAFFCFAVVHYSIFEKKKKDLIRDIFIVVGYICSNIPVDTRTMKSKNSLRLIVCCMLIFVFFMTFLVQAYLLSVTTHPLREHQITHLDEALAKCKPLKSTMYLITYRSKDPPDCLTVMECLQKLTRRRKEKLYTSVADINFNTVVWHFIDSNGETEVVKTMEPLLQLLRTVYFERGSGLVSNYNRISQLSRVSGLSVKDSREVFNMIRLKQAKQKLKLESPEWLHQFREVFLVLLIGYSLATIVFIYECKFNLKVGS